MSPDPEPVTKTVTDTVTEVKTETVVQELPESCLAITANLSKIKKQLLIMGSQSGDLTVIGHNLYAAISVGNAAEFERLTTDYNRHQDEIAQHGIGYLRLSEDVTKTEDLCLEDLGDLG